MDKILEKINEIKQSNGYHDDRCIKAIFRCIEEGVSINNREKLFEEVLKEYQTGKHVRLSKIKDKFKKTMQFITKNFAEFYE